MALLQDHFDICDRCDGYVIVSGVYRSMTRAKVCRCDENESLACSTASGRCPQPLNPLGQHRQAGSVGGGYGTAVNTARERGTEAGPLGCSLNPASPDPANPKPRRKLTITTGRAA